MYHSENGLFFSRNEDGSVRITKRAGGKATGDIEFEQTLSDGVWCSAVCNVSKGGEIDNRWYKHKDFHNGTVSHINGLTFGEALEIMKKSCFNKTIPTFKLARYGWKTKNAWVSALDPYHNLQFSLTEKNTEGTFMPYLGYKNEDNAYVPYVPTTQDLFASDWYVMEGKCD